MASKLLCLVLFVMYNLFVPGCSQAPVPQGTNAPKDAAIVKAPQAEQHLVHMGGLIFDPTRKQPDIPAALDNSGQFATGSNLYIVQFIEYGSQVAFWRERLKETGATVGGHYIPDNAILVLMDDNQATQVRKMQFVRAVLPYLAAFKIDKVLKLPTGELRPDIDQVPLLIETWTVADKQAVINLIGQLNGKVLDGAASTTNRLAAMLPKENIVRLVEVPLIVRMAEAIPRVQVDSDGTKHIIDYG